MEDEVIVVEQNSEEVQNRVRNALANAKDLIIGGKSYLESQLLQRIEGPTNAGSSYENVTPVELLQKLYDANWEMVQVDSVMQGCTAFRAEVPGKNGIVDIETIPEDTPLYAIDPKGTGKIGIGAAGIQKKPEKYTYIIVGEQQGKEVVYTFHPGMPVSPSIVESTKYPHGSLISRKDAESLGFSKAKFLSEDMVNSFQKTVDKER